MVHEQNWDHLENNVEKNECSSSGEAVGEPLLSVEISPLMSVDWNYLSSVFFLHNLRCVGC